PGETVWLTPPRRVRRQVQHPGSGGTAMYTLTLISDERRAFDWVGSRYNSGKGTDLLMDRMPDDREWSGDGDITFLIPEHVAWAINELAEEEGYSWACVAPALAAKLKNPSEASSEPPRSRAKPPRWTSLNE